MLNRTNIKYIVDLTASVAIVLTCAFVIWLGVESRGTANTSSGSKPSVPAVEDLASERLSISVSSAPLLGKTSTSLVLIEFSDFECPFCGRFAESTFKELKHNFIDNDTISYVYFHSPLARIHPFALKSARVAECASDQGKFWEAHAGLFRTAAGPGLSDESIAAVVNELQLERPIFETCLSEVSDRIQSDIRVAGRSGVRATPTFLLGVRTDDGNVSIRRRINGAQPVEVFASAITQLKD